MRKFGAGFIGMIAGAALWISASIIGAIASIGDDDIPHLWEAIIAVGFVTMIGFPLVYWVVLPIKHRLQRKKNAGDIQSGRSAD